MKKIILSVSLLTLFSFSTISCSSDDNNNDSSYTETIATTDLPVSATGFLTQYFNNEPIKLVQRAPIGYDNKSGYKVYLNSGLEIDFDANGNWEEIESENGAKIPDAFTSQEIPQILAYVQNNYPQNWIVSIDKEPYGYSVELNNDIDLIFNSSQQFIAIDRDTEEQEFIINPADLPETAKNFVNTNFQGAQYIMVKKEIENQQTIYDVYLSTGYKLEFDVNGNWLQVEANTNNTEIPKTIIPSSIQNYLATNYATYSVKEIQKEVYGYSVEVTKNFKDIEIKFDSNGEFLGIDN